jgi:hypothetical protein
VITFPDLSTVSTSVSPDLTVTHNVEAPNGTRYVLFATDVTEDDLELLDPFTVLFYMAYPQYRQEVSVFRADKDWEIIGVCGPDCAEGMCTRRVAEDCNTGEIGRAYELLLNYLNA